MAEIIDGRKIAENLIEKNLRPRAEKLKTKKIFPKLVVILIGENAASESYVRQKKIFAEKCGILSEVRNFPENVAEKKILDEIEKINRDAKIHGIIVQLPVPRQISVRKILEKISPEKDTDGFSPENIGKLFLGEKCLPCCTPAGILRMLQFAEKNLAGKKITIVGRSNTVGKPAAILALQQNATVKICHSKTKNLFAEIADAEILVVAVGRPEFLRGENLPKNSIIIDVGIHRKNGKLCGDVHFESAKKIARKISPVPGGVGPMTVASLIENTILAAENFAEKNNF